jgi:hypothetical protein
MEYIKIDLEYILNYLNINYSYKQRDLSNIIVDVYYPVVHERELDPKRGWDPAVLLHMLWICFTYPKD